MTVNEVEDYCKEHDMFSCIFCPDNPAPVGNSTPTEPDELTAVLERLSFLEKQVSTFVSDRINPVSEQISLQDSRKQKVLEAAQAKINEIEQEKHSLVQEKYSLDKQLAEMKYELSELQKEHAKALSARRANERLQSLYDSLRTAWESLPWNEFMFDFQREDILFTLQAFKDGKTGVLNANDRGMGKTFEAGATIDLITHLFLEEHGRMPRVLWLTKKGIVGQTYRELLKWNTERNIVVLGMSRMVPGPLYDTIKMGANKQTREFQLDAAMQIGAWVVSNYDVLNTTPVVTDVNWDVVVVDEVHKLKGGSNCTTRYCDHTENADNCKATGLWRKTKKIVNRYNSETNSTPFFMPLSGTPIQNHPKDAWAYLHLFRPEMFPSSKRFEREYAYGYGIEGYKVDWERLIKALSSQVIRRRKDEVGIDLPDKIVEYIMDELTGEQADIYRQMAERMIVKLEGMGDKQLSTSWLLPQWNYLSQILQDPGSVTWREKDPDTGAVEEYQLPETNSVKLEITMEMVEELINEGEQVIIYSTFKKPLHKLSDKVNSLDLEFNSSGSPCRSEVITGDTKDTDDIIQRFQQGITHVICATIETLGEGANLQKNPTQWDGGSSHCIFLNLWWNPAKNVQAEDRIHRQGQTDPATIHVVQIENSIDAYIAEVNANKQAMQDGIMEAEEIRPAIEWAEIMKGWL